MKINFLDRFSKNKKICSVGAELFHADGQTDVTKLIVTFLILLTRVETLAGPTNSRIFYPYQKKERRMYGDEKLKDWVGEMDYWVEQVTDQSHAWKLFNFPSFVADDEVLGFGAVSLSEWVIVIFKDKQPKILRSVRNYSS
jgi:hypothetical protein